MALLIDYFLAPSDEAAALTLTLDGGPMSLGDSVGEPRFPTVSDSRIEPVVALGTLTMLMTGQDFDDILDDPTHGRLITQHDSNERMVLGVSDTLIDALAGASTEELDQVAHPWSQTEELVCIIAEAHLRAFIHSLADLAKTARSVNSSLYCWVCL